MFKDETKYISPKYTKSDYTEIGLTILSNETDFKTAINIFQDRMHGRFMQQINLLRKDLTTNGFAIMALECLLIESLGQFVSGKDNNRNCSATEYQEFLKDQLGFTAEDAKNFYHCIRCGILHQAQTNNQSALIPYGYDVTFYEGGLFFVGVDRFCEMMDQYFNDYCDRLLDSQNTILRLNFIKKMDYICNR